MTHTACILKPRGPFHVGDREGMREGSEAFIHSDTLFSALCHSFLLLYGKTELERFLAAYAPPSPFPPPQGGGNERDGVQAPTLLTGTSPLTLSSAFPVWKDTFYFPVPRNQSPPDKDAKKVRFLPLPVFEKALAGRLADGDWLSGIPAPRPAGETGKGLSRPWSVEDVPKVTVPRLTCHQTGESGAFYHLGQTWYREGALFFLMQVADNWCEKTNAAIRLMCDEGIGGYRSIGKGQFEQPEIRKVSLRLPDAEGSLLLSLYYPGDGEEAGLTEGCYDLAPRKGYVFSPETRSLRRKQVMMFGEGSVFPGKSRKGKLVDVTPDNAKEHGLPHRVYRNGLAFAVPCHVSVISSVVEESPAPEKRDFSTRPRPASVEMTSPGNGGRDE